MLWKSRHHHAVSPSPAKWNSVVMLQPPCYGRQAKSSLHSAQSEPHRKLCSPPISLTRNHTNMRLPNGIPNIFICLQITHLALEPFAHFQMGRNLWRPIGNPRMQWEWIHSVKQQDAVRACLICCLPEMLEIIAERELYSSTSGQTDEIFCEGMTLAGQGKHWSITLHFGFTADKNGPIIASLGTWIKLNHSTNQNFLLHLRKHGDWH